MADIAEQMFATNVSAGGGRVTLIRQRSTDIAQSQQDPGDDQPAAMDGGLRKPVDVIVAEVLDSDLLGEGILGTYAHAVKVPFPLPSPCACSFALASLATPPAGVSRTHHEQTTCIVWQRCLRVPACAVYGTKRYVPFSSCSLTTSWEKALAREDAIVIPAGAVVMAQIVESQALADMCSLRQDALGAFAVHLDPVCWWTASPDPLGEWQALQPFCGQQVDRMTVCGAAYPCTLGRTSRATSFGVRTELSWTTVLLASTRRHVCLGCPAAVRPFPGQVLCLCRSRAGVARQAATRRGR